MLLGKSFPDKFEVYNDYNANLVNLFRCMRDRPMEFIRELGFLNLNSRDDFTVIKRFFQKEEFGEKYLEQQLKLTNIMLSELQAKELCELYRQSKEDYDLKRAVMFLKLVVTAIQAAENPLPVSLSMWQHCLPLLNSSANALPTPS